MSGEFDSPAGRVTRGAVELHRGDRVDQVLTLIDGQGERLAIFACTLQCDGVRYEAGDYVPATIRNGVLESCLRLGRIETDAPPRGAVLIPIAVRVSVSPAAPPAAPVSMETATRTAADPPATVSQPEAAPQPGPSPQADGPAWYATRLDQVVSVRVARALKAQGLNTAGDLDTYANAHGGELSGLKLNDKQLKDVYVAMADLARPPQAAPVEAAAEPEAADVAEES